MLELEVEEKTFNKQTSLSRQIPHPPATAPHPSGLSFSPFSQNKPHPEAAGLVHVAGAHASQPRCLLPCMPPGRTDPGHPNTISPGLASFCGLSVVDWVSGWGEGFISLTFASPTPEDLSPPTFPWEVLLQPTQRLQ